jgi:3-deoxy-7-phosphoheptulonate synthase
LLEGVINARGVKVGPSATPEDIEDLALTLNSDKLPGQLSFILRLGLKHLDRAPELVEAIERHAPEALIISDPLHGNTYTENNLKTRAVQDAEQEIKTIAGACQKIGRKLNGLHLEAITSWTLRQCVEIRGQLPNPNDKGLVDPQFNLTQKMRVLTYAKPYLI